MKTAYGKLAALAFVLIIAVVLFAPMRSGMEDYLYARPRSIRMNRGDTYDITWRLDSPIQAKYLKKTNKLVVG